MIEAIEIQTASHCNGRCIICPHESVSKTLSQGVMSDELFEKILPQLKGIKRIIPYFNNEPFLDQKFADRLKMIRAAYPHAELEIATNCSMLDRNMQSRIQGIKIDELRLSIFGFNKDTHGKVMKGLDWHNVKRNLDCLVKNKKLIKSIGQAGIVMIDHPLLTEEDVRLAKEYCKKNSLDFNLWGFFDRSSNVKTFSNGVNRNKVNGCEQDRPLKRMHVTYEGKVVLCCMDWKQEYVLGDLNLNSIEEVWKSEKYEAIRKAIYGGGCPPYLCRRCKLSQ
ncbi:MAG: radical SAM/SPASM domain-containing protein [Candidatus Woesearchaeota archaeon]